MMLNGARLTPPGLNTPAAMMPVKVEVNDPKLSIEQMLPPTAGPVPVEPTYAPRTDTGEWFHTVLSVAPHLRPEGIHQALRILDCAMVNAQQVKALDDVITKTSDTPQVQHAALRARNQVHQQQEKLLSELHTLRFDYGVASNSPIGGAHGLSTGGGNLENNALVEAVHAALTGSGSADVAKGMSAAVGGVPPLPPLAPPGVSHPVTAPAASLVQAAQMLQAQAAQAMQAAHVVQAAQTAQAALVAQAAHAANAQAQAAQAFQAVQSAQGAAKLSLSGAIWPQQAMPLGKPLQEHAMTTDPVKAPRPVQTLSMSLQLLSQEDPNSLFIVRRINKLGFKASRALKRFFSQYGKVVRVLVAHSTVRQQGDSQNQVQVRKRPSSLGFVQMASVEVAQAILRAGGEQEIEGCIITVQRFEKQHASADEQEKEVAEASICSTSASSQDLVSSGKMTVQSSISEDGSEEALIML